MTRPAEHLEEGWKHEQAGDLEHAVDCYAASLAASGDDPQQVTAALVRISHARRKQSRWQDALAAAEQAAQVARAAGLRDEHSLSLNAEGAVHHSRGDFERARTLYARAVEVAELPGTRARALQNLGVLAALAGRLDEAERDFLEASGAFAEAGDSAGAAFVLSNYTALALDRADYVEAERRALQALEAARDVGNLDLLGHARLNYAEALFGQGQLDRAETEATVALGFFDAAGNTLRRIGALRVLGDMHHASGHDALARRFFERAMDDALRIGAEADRRQLEARLAALADRAQ